MITIESISRDGHFRFVPANISLAEYGEDIGPVLEEFQHKNTNDGCVPSEDGAFIRGWTTEDGTKSEKELAKFDNVAVKSFLSSIK